MNHEFLEQMVTGTPIYEMHLITGQIIIAEIIDIDSVDPTFMLYYPLKIVDRQEGQYLAKWFYSSRDPWIQINKSSIIAYSECTLDMKTKYASTTLQLDGIQDLIPPAPAPDESYH